MTENCDGRAYSASHAAGKRRSDGQTIAEIVDPVTQDHHPGHCSHRARDRVTVVVSVTMTVAMAVGVPKCRVGVVRVDGQGLLCLAKALITLVEKHVMGGICIAFQSW